MGGFQNTKTRLKDNNTLSASTTLLKADIVISANAVAGTIRAAEFIANGASGAANTATVEALYAKTTLGTGNSVNTRACAARFVLDYSNGVSINANTAYGVIIDATRNTGATRGGGRPTAFLMMTDVGSDAANGVQYLMELGAPNGNATQGYVNSTSGCYFGANNVATANGALAIRCNGVVRYIGLYSGLT